MLAVMLIMSPAVGYGQEQSPNKATPDSAAEDKKKAPSVMGEITDVIQAQKEKYQKDIQDQIQNKIKSVEDKFNALKSPAGKPNLKSPPNRRLPPQLPRPARRGLKKNRLRTRVRLPTQDRVFGEAQRSIRSHHGFSQSTLGHSLEISRDEPD